MSAPHDGQPNLRRAVVLMTVSSFVVPAAGLLTQPMLAQALGVVGRGQLAAAVAPAALALAVATLGLPDALTYFLAKDPRLSSRALAWASSMTLALGLVCLLVVYLTIPLLSGGDSVLGNLILLSMAITVPALLVGVLRGAATGRQMWRAVALEKIANAAFRIVALGGFWIAGYLDVLNAVLITVAGPLFSGLVFWRLFTRPESAEDAADREVIGQKSVLAMLMSYGSRVWLGSVASMLLARVGQVLMVPLSSVTDLGLYTVATTVADVPIIVALAIAGALTGVNSRHSEPKQITKTSRLTLAVGALGCGVLGLTVPALLPPLFGAEFAAAVVPTLMLLAAAVICIPGMMASAGLSAWGRPGIRSIGLGVALGINLAVFVIMVPFFGVLGACWTSIATNVVMTTYMVVACSRTINVRVLDFVQIRLVDVRILAREVAKMSQMVGRRLPWKARRS